MNHKQLQQILIDLEKVSVDIQLQLPTGGKAIDRQMRQIQIAQQQLKTIAQTLNSLSIQESSHQTLTRVIAGFLREADNMLILAEEFPIDPAGAIGCLENVNRRKTVLIQQIEKLKIASSTASDYTKRTLFA